MNHNTDFTESWCWSDGHPTSQLVNCLLILLYPLGESKDVLNRLLEKRRFELAAMSAFRLGRCYILW